jgi:hypothetical protein
LQPVSLSRCCSPSCPARVSLSLIFDADYSVSVVCRQLELNGCAAVSGAPYFISYPRE